MARSSGSSLTLRTAERGPFFRGDPGQRFRDNVHADMDRIARKAERTVAAQLRIGQGGRGPVSRIGGRVADHVVGRTASLSGASWHRTAVVSIAAGGLRAEDRLALFAAAAGVERATRAFRQANAVAAREIRADELLKGVG